MQSHLKTTIAARPPGRRSQRIVRPRARRRRARCDDRRRASSRGRPRCAWARAWCKSRCRRAVLSFGLSITPELIGLALGKEVGKDLLEAADKADADRHRPGHGPIDRREIATPAARAARETDGDRRRCAEHSRVAEMLAEQFKAASRAYAASGRDVAADQAARCAAKRLRRRWPDRRSRWPRRKHSGRSSC